ncbi:MAG: RdgB/HAM1 family non-canonical purine NTP pyrophosphatase [Lentisphaeria bacterium]|nr:RdgB/HAM1 family non-canonical purine NTP pyrophosphatase [Lentisphaeria bacterium]
MKLLAASKNTHKISEFQHMLSQNDDVQILSANEIEIADVIEDADSFVGNATKKALEISLQHKLPVIADDSGLEVFSLNGEPGIYSARYGGDAALTDADRMNLVLQKLEGKEDRSARFVAVLAFAYDGEVLGTFEGEVRGTIALEAKGQQGFGYDPIFIPDAFDKSFAELGAEIKDSMSHRANALSKALESGIIQKLKSLI